MTATEGQSTGFDTLPPPPPRALYRYRGWRRLRSMRTALILLGLVALASAIAGLVPQRPNVPDTADGFLKGTAPWLHPVVDALGLFDVFGALWFQGLVVALIVVLLACLLPRTRALTRNWRSLRQPPSVGPFPRTGRHATMETAVPVGQATAAIRAALRGKAYRLSVPNEAGQFVAERGFAREAGSLVFHWSLLVVILGAFLTQGFGFRAVILMAEGQEWANNPGAYNVYTPGRFFRDAWLAEFTVRVESFDVSYRDDLSAEDFVTHVTIFERGVAVKEKLIRVNDPLVHGGAKFFQADYGWAPVVRVSHRGTPLYEGPVVMPDRGAGRCGSSEGVVRLPSLDPQAAVVLEFYPDPVLVDTLPPQAGDEFRRSCPDEGPRPVNLTDDPGRSGGLRFGRNTAFGFPVLAVRHFEGDLRSSEPQNVYTIDTAELGLEEVRRALLVPPQLAGAQLSDRAELDRGLSVEFLELRRFTVLIVKGDPGVPVVAAAAVLILVGLLPSLLSWRRRFWVHVIERPGQPSLVELGGVAYQRKEHFDDEFTAVSRRLRAALPVPPREPLP